MPESNQLSEPKSNQSSEPESNQTSEPKSIVEIFKSIFELYFKLLDKPLPFFLRFLYATLGSLTLIFSGYLFLLKYGDLIEGLSLINPIIVISVPVGICVFYGLLIALTKTRHGPVRLYLSGVLLPALVISIIRITWGF